MSKYWAVLMIVALLAGSFATAATANTQSLPAMDVLVPGAFHEIDQDLTINVVFVGYEPGAGYQDVDTTKFMAELADTYKVYNRYPKFYGLDAGMGLTFNYDYNLVFTDQSFEDAFFTHLAAVGAPAPLTAYQEAYNAQANKTGMVTDNFQIEVSDVEQWLADNTQSMLGVDTTQYTVFFINWYGRPDFKFHVYAKTDEPDPDTGMNFGNRELIISTIKQKLVTSDCQ